jgi:hypothetical protein
VQAGKWIRIDLRGIPVTGLRFSHRKASPSAGSVVVTHLAGDHYPGFLGLGGNFSPIVMKADKNGNAIVPDYTTQATYDPSVTGVVTQTPAAGSTISVGTHNIGVVLTTGSGLRSSLGFYLVVQALAPPRLALLQPASSITPVIQAFPYRVKGTISDLERDGISWVKVALNGGAPVNATVGAPNASGVSEWSLDVSPNSGSNTVVVTAEDANGVSSNTVSRTFTFTRRYVLEVARTAPPGISLGTAGTVTLSALGSTALAPTTADANPRTSEVTPATAVRLTAVPNAGYILSHWTGTPVGATVSGTVVTFTMPSADVSGITAHFVSRNPFLAPAGQGSVFYGLIRPDNAADTANGTVGFLTGTLTGTTGSFSGKALIGGVTQAFVATFFGNGTSLFSVGTSRLPSLTFSGYTLTLSYASGAIVAVVEKAGITSRSTARRLIHTSTNKVRTALLNAASTIGSYNVALSAKAQTPSVALNTYPQGDGVATATLTNLGLVTFAGTLADGTIYTASSGLVIGDESPVFAQLLTPGSTTLRGSSFGGLLRFDETAADSDVSATDLLWIRATVTEVAGTTAAARATQLYTAGWPSGITVDAVGALYNRTTTAQASLDLATVATGVKNAVLDFTEGKLSAAISQDGIRIVGNVVTKVPLTNPAFTLGVVTTNGTFSGTFAPNWTSASTLRPTFRGIILQKGASKGGYGFFISNRTSDSDPESGRATLGKP